MKIIELDLTGCASLYDIHERIRTAFHFPEWYGKNWSAFWDLLRSECDADQVIIKGTNHLSHEFDPHIKKMCDILERNILFRQNLSLNSFAYKVID